MTKPTATDRKRARTWTTHREQLADDAHPVAARTIHHEAQRLARQRLERTRTARRLLDSL